MIKKLIIDFGLGYTKVGFGTDSEPIKIIPTPSLFNLEEFFTEKAENLNILSYIQKNTKKILEIEEFACNIINDALQIYKTDPKYMYYCYILFDLDLKENFHEIFFAFIKYLYETFSFIASIKIIPKNFFPVFVSGFYSGIILDSGYAFSTITVVNNGITVSSKKVGYGSCDMQRFLYRYILNDVIQGKNGKKMDEKNLEIFKKNLVKYMDDIMVRISYILNRKVSQEYKLEQQQKESDSDKNEKNKEKEYLVGFYEDIPNFNIDFNTRVILGEKIFGENNEKNFAYLILKSMKEDVPCEIRRKIGSNIILSGGITMLNGFYQRFLDEIKYISENNKEFERLKGIKNDIRVHKIIYPRNIITWVGASLFLTFCRFNFPGNEINRIIEDKREKKLDTDELTKFLDNLRI